MYQSHECICGKVCETSLVVQMVKRLPAMQETRVQSLGWEDPLEKEMAAHSSILAWKIPWTEEPGRLSSMGSQRVGHDWATSLSLYFHFTFTFHVSSISGFWPLHLLPCSSFLTYKKLRWCRLSWVQLSQHGDSCWGITRIQLYPQFRDCASLPMRGTCWG